MNQGFASLMMAGIVLAAGSCAVLSADPVPGNDHLRQGYGGQVEILVDGTPRPRYAHNGRWYVEALKGCEYAIRLRNPYPVRVAVALSVDGLNTIDAQHTSASGARKWVLEPYQTVTISGWQINRSEARKFEFTTEPNSYAQALGKAANLGVISAAFFRERVASVATESARRHGSRAEQDAPSAPASPVPLGETADAGQGFGAQAQKLNQEYAATGMGARTGHAVTFVNMDLEPTPAQTVNIRYEFRAQLVKLGILPQARMIDPLQRRERARGFEGFSPEVR
jgi:hypothetical protein